jgi:membrane protease YdiL (CAAX protease family)
VLFASIHPQGILGLPALGGLATLFCLLRETRNSLIAPMTAHAMVNGTTLLLLSLIDLS